MDCPLFAIFYRADFCKWLSIFINIIKCTVYQNNRCKGRIPLDETGKIVAVMHQFEEAGLVLKDIDMLLNRIADQILGIGLGEQGIVTSKEDVRRALEVGI